jgi:hypothetical protein
VTTITGPGMGAGSDGGSIDEQRPGGSLRGVRGKSLISQASIDGGKPDLDVQPSRSAAEQVFMARNAVPRRAGQGQGTCGGDGAPVGDRHSPWSSRCKHLLMRQALG